MPDKTADKTVFPGDPSSPRNESRQRGDGEYANNVRCQTGKEKNG